jgi:hypothetical protein
MSTFLVYLGLALILGGVFGCSVSAVAFMSKDEAPDNDAGAPEGATILPFVPKPQSSSH